MSIIAAAEAAWFTTASVFLFSICSNQPTACRFDFLSPAALPEASIEHWTIAQLWLSVLFL